ncbi:hypothetical protein SLS62_005515 [Diatrype stigma]|uniref:gamma-glutamylcyclotransferase n=1 Tax=Diatrype stigma TaxID=117547 RepID=A0AAN9USZ9_9PEZI
MNPAELAIEEGRSRCHQEAREAAQGRARAQAQARTECQFRRMCNGLLSLPSIAPRRQSTAQTYTTSSNSNPPSSPAIPPISPQRLAQASIGSHDDTNTSTTPTTVLYLAYGSNLSAETFLGTRGIKPLSQTNVRAPLFTLTFDLAGIPYQEPSFANIAPLEIPKPKKPLPLPPKLPPGIPGDPTNPPPANSLSLSPWTKMFYKDGSDGGAAAATATPKNPTWTKGLYGVVYEVTREDYATIIRTEGGGSAYRDVLTPCVPLPPDFRIPEKPSPVPELPRPFLAHTLYAPRIPGDDGGDDDNNYYNDEDEDGDDDNCISRLRRRLAKLALPVRRPDPSYAQPSTRYLQLIRDGAAEHGLPGDYRRYLEEAVRPYKRTTWRQEVGRVLFLALWAPVLMVVLGMSWSIGKSEDEGEGEGQDRIGGGGKNPGWLSVLMSVVMNLMWMSYDTVFHPVFGDGERTEENDGDDGASWHDRGRFGRRHAMRSDEGSTLLGTWKEQHI